MLLNEEAMPFAWFLTKINNTKKVKKYVVSSKPDILRIAPENINADSGWVDDVQYTVVIKKGSTISNGAVLKDDYTFTFINSIKELEDIQVD